MPEKVNGLSKQRQKYIQSLHNKKYRRQYGVFLVEGQKSILELFDSDFEIEELFLTSLGDSQVNFQGKVTLCSDAEVKKASFLQTNNFGIAIVRMKDSQSIEIAQDEWVLALDDIRDPGNLGTIIRTADWYGIKTIICSHDTVDCYNPKVISSTMGSFARVNLVYAELKDYLSKVGKPVYGAVLNGENVHSQSFQVPGVLIIGSESHGISPEIETILDHRLTIPNFGNAESLNAGIATAILLDNIKRGVSRA